MKKSLRAKRMARNHRKHGQHPKLNLVSLMDIFTILVFFLMVNSGDVEVLSADKSITLPDSIAETKPAMTITIKVSDSNIIVQGNTIGSLESPEGVAATLAALNKELVYQASRRSQLSEEEKLKGRSVIIMGDQSMPYDLLKQLMTTCSANDYRDISLAVNRVAEQPEVDAPPSLES
ncbi:biopolymer transporter ExbD [Oceanicoccus sp. KOV_DT_Chl]|uniref:ExbD/TolR family protein n=1 Tax=Oceanicoccus sp. KOV_DT_Chl TaxID=1904639 RepID=UPI000C7D6E28|nr:biopolymer transporter ExbD [Oceanicoccus sp. KOV_DT_Chl]